MGSNHIEPMDLKGLIKWLEDSSYLARVAVNASHANGIDESIREIKRFSEALGLGMQKPLRFKYLDSQNVWQLIQERNDRVDHELGVFRFPDKARCELFAKSLTLPCEFEE